MLSRAERIFSTSKLVISFVSICCRVKSWRIRQTTMVWSLLSLCPMATTNHNTPAFLVISRKKLKSVVLYCFYASRDCTQLMWRNLKCFDNEWAEVLFEFKTTNRISHKVHLQMKLPENLFFLLRYNNPAKTSKSRINICLFFPRQRRHFVCRWSANLRWFIYCSAYDIRNRAFLMHFNGKDYE